MSANAQVGIATNIPNSTLDINGSVSFKVSTITGNTTLGIGHAVVLCNTAADFVVTLPTAAGINGRVYTIKNINTGYVTIETTAGETIDGYFFFVLGSVKNSIQVISDGTNWVIINSIGATAGTVDNAFQVGIIAYIFQPGDPGYIAEQAHDLIAATADHSSDI